MSDIREKLMNLTVAETVSYSVTALVVLIGFVSIITTVAKTGSYRDKLFMMESQRTQLKGQLQQEMGTDLAGDAGLANESLVDAEGNLIIDDGATDIIITGKGSAQSVGVSVANFQNRYILATLDRSDGQLVSSDAESRANAYSMLLPYFAEGYESFAESWYDPSHQYQNGTSNNFMWEFDCKYSFEGSQLPVVWTCRHVRGKGPDNIDCANELVAYVTGIYDLNTGKFSGMRKYVTTVGNPMTVGYVKPNEVVMPPKDPGSSGDDVLGDDFGTESVDSVSENFLEQDVQSDDLWGSDDDSEIVELETENQNELSVLDGNDNGGLPDNFFQ